MHTHRVICLNLDNYKLYSLHKQVFVLKIQLASERIPSNAISSEQVHVMQKGNLLVETRMLKNMPIMSIVHFHILKFSQRRQEK